MIESAHGLVIRTRRLTETSLIVEWLTPEFGRLSTVAKGALRAKSPFRGKLDLFFEADLTFVRSRRSELHTLREMNLRSTQPALRQDLARLRQAAYGAALIEMMTEIETPLGGVYELMRGFLEVICSADPEPKIILALELKLLVDGGLKPDFQRSRLRPATQRLAEDLAGSSWPDVIHLEADRTQTAELRQFLHQFMSFHLGRVPRTRNAVFASSD